MIVLALAPFVLRVCRVCARAQAVDCLQTFNHPIHAFGSAAVVDVALFCVRECFLREVLTADVRMMLLKCV